MRSTTLAPVFDEPVALAAPPETIACPVCEERRARETEIDRYCEDMLGRPRACPYCGGVGSLLREVHEERERHRRAS